MEIPHAKHPVWQGVLQETMQALLQHLSVEAQGDQGGNPPD
jgi:hypothetical protein